MAYRDPTIWMWAEACRFLERAENLQRRFFDLGEAASQPSWEPPIDIFETGTDLIIEIALPGVDPARMQAIFDSGRLGVIGERSLPAMPRTAVVRRLELPHGRFERWIALPPGRYEVARREVINGCLVLTLRKFD